MNIYLTVKKSFNRRVAMFEHIRPSGKPCHTHTFCLARWHCWAVSRKLFFIAFQFKLTSCLIHILQKKTKRYQQGFYDAAVKSSRPHLCPIKIRNSEQVKVVDFNCGQFQLQNSVYSSVWWTESQLLTFKPSQLSINNWWFMLCGIRPIQITNHKSGVSQLPWLIYHFIPFCMMGSKVIGRMCCHTL